MKNSPHASLGPFPLQEELVDSLFADGAATTAQARYTRWRKKLRKKQLPLEHLVPRILREFELEEAPFMDRRSPAAVQLGRKELRQRLKELGPWRLPFRFDDHVTSRRPGGRERILYRRQLINGTVAGLLGEELGQCSVLDLGCNAGFFSLDLADRGARHVTGIDLRPANIAQASFLASYYGIENTDFRVLDVDHIPQDQQWDVVLNLGVLYHVTNPLQFLRRTYELCRRFAVIDTATHLEPVSGYFLILDKDVDKPTEGREVFELHPTYRGLIDSVRCAGFSKVYEVVGRCDPQHELYESGTRRCLIAFK